MMNDFHYMSQEEKENWLKSIVQDASEKVAVRPASRKSIYWEEKRKQIQQTIEENNLKK
jgi:hypothetical protein